MSDRPVSQNSIHPRQPRFCPIHSETSCVQSMLYLFDDERSQFLDTSFFSQLISRGLLSLDTLTHDSITEMKNRDLSCDTASLGLTL